MTVNDICRIYNGTPYLSASAVLIEAAVRQKSLVTYTLNMSLKGNQNSDSEMFSIHYHEPQ